MTDQLGSGYVFYVPFTPRVLGDVSEQASFVCEVQAGEPLLSDYLPIHRRPLARPPVFGPLIFRCLSASVYISYLFLGVLALIEIL